MTNEGTIVDASCNAPPPPDSSCAAPSITTMLNPGTVNPGGSCTITWSASDATACTLTGPNVNQSGLSGAYTTPAIDRTSIYMLTCQNGAVVATTKALTCRLNPAFKEI